MAYQCFKYPFLRATSSTISSAFLRLTPNSFIASSMNASIGTGTSRRSTSGGTSGSGSFLVRFFFATISAPR